MADILGWWRGLRWGRARPWAWAAGVLFAAIGLWRVETVAGDAADAVAALRESERRDDARACTTVWEGRVGVRSLIDGLVTASPDADPARVAAFREDMARRLPDPECDLEAANRVLDERPDREG